MPAASDPDPYAGTPLQGGDGARPEDSDAFAEEALGIDPRRLLEITRDVCVLIGEYRTEMGLEYGNPEPRWGSWAWWRRIARSEYAGRFAHRYLTGYGGVFDAPGGNLSLGVPARFVATRAAGHADNLVGTDPFVAAMPTDISNKGEAALSREVEEKLQEELTRSNIRGVVREAIRVALTENDSVIKLTWVTQKAQRPELRPVAVYVESGARRSEMGDGRSTSDGGAMADGGAITDGSAASDGGATPDGNATSDGSAMADGGGMGNGSTTPGGFDPVALLAGMDAEAMGAANAAARAAAEPLRTPKGDFIFQHDDIVLCLAATNTGEFQALYAPGDPVPEGQYVQARLKKEPAFVFDPATMLGPDSKPVFQTVPGLIGTDTIQDCLVGAGLQVEDFLYDIKQPKLMDSPLQVHVYDDELDRVLAAYGHSSDPAEKYAPLKAGLNFPAPEEDSPKSGASMPKREHGEYYNTQGSSIRRKCNVHECYYRVRLHPDDANETWLFLVLDYARQVPLHAEYLGNMRMKSPPFRILRGLESVPSRAYGVGIYQKFHERNLAVDYWFNRAKLKTTKNASADFMKVDAFIEAQDAQEFRMGGTEIYRVKSELNDRPLGPSNPVIWRENLHDQNQLEWEMIQKIIQTGQIEFGIADIGQLQDEGAQIAKDATATATRNVERTGNTLQRATENMMAEDLTGLCELAIDLILENADLETLRFSPGGQLLAGLNRDEIRDLPRQVRLLLTKARSSESLANNQQAVAMIQQYDAMRPSMQKQVRFAFIAMLRSLDVQDADDILVEPSDEEIQAEGQQRPPPPNPHLGESIGIKLADLLPSEQAQALQQIGIQADPQRGQGGGQSGQSQQSAQQGAQQSTSMAPMTPMTSPQVLPNPSAAA
ncbi:hypothetical protein [Chthoniobacter flavus]|uniref:hypothetical protein n=1 Tax=Chthoniobacter flavus TaxID=191863 RepID=UPI00031D1758|nr:hypothetical protein [Chthoniobacter flavus]